MTNPFLRYYAVILSSVLFAGRFAAAESALKGGQSQAAEPVYILSDVVSMALQDNPLLISEGARAEEKLLAGSQTRSIPGPSLEIATGRRADESTSGALFEAAISQPLLLLGKQDLRGRLFELESKSWEAQHAASRSLIASEVVRRSIEYAINRRWASFVETRQKRFSLIKSYMEGRVFPSPQKRAESRIVQNRLKTLLSEALQAQANFRSSFENLRVYAPMEPGVYPEIRVPWFSGTQSLDLNEWMERALKNNPELWLKDISIKSAETEKALASKDKWPDPKLIASYEQGKATERETNMSLGIGLDFPYWNGNRSGVRSAESKRIAEQGARDFQERQIKAQLPQAMIEYEAARTAVKEYPEALLDELEAQLRESEDGFRKGQVDLLTFLELDDSSAEAFRHILDSQMSFITKVTDLFRLTGEQDVLARLESL